ncbi:MAG: type II secretion system GspH family protein [Opitutaceae bacterium]|jgi:prepilin-type N-terminal cleavage/methylation domain-containing protein/prepilin-type processing-associated H-X9-DG protein|nr:type II secretion system GspH family protein [Opitutaceae bacterium]
MDTVSRNQPCIPDFLRAAFTLTELLVVIAVIGILAGILLPVVSIVRTSARTASCKSNLRQIGVGIHLYIQDNKGFLPGPFAYGVSQGYKKTSGENNNRYFFAFLAPYLDLPEAKTDVRQARHGLCPGWLVAMASTPEDQRGSVYVLNHNLQDTDGSQWSPWGHKSINPPQPFSRLTPEQLTRSWALQDADKKSVGDTVRNDSTVGNCPLLPVHGNSRNTLYFDAHVGSSPIPPSPPLSP